MMKYFCLFATLFLQQLSFAQNLPELIPFVQNGVWGYCDQNKKIVIPCQFKDAYPFYEDRALVFKDNPMYNDGDGPFILAAFIDRTGKEVFALNSMPMGFPASRFQDGVALIENYNTTVYTDQRSISVVDKNGKELQRIAGVIFDFELSMYHEYAPPFNKDGVYYALEDSTHNIVFIYKDGRPALRTNYTYVGKFNEGFAVAMYAYNAETDSYDNALINTDGKEVIKAGKFSFISNYENNIAVSDGLVGFTVNERSGFVNTKGDIVINAQFEMATGFSEGLAAVGKIISGTMEEENILTYYGYINTKGELVIPYQFGQAFQFKNGMAEVTRNDSILFIDKTGKVLLGFSRTNGETKYEAPFNWSYGAFVYEHGFRNGKAILLQNDMVGWINTKGEFIVPPFYYGIGRIGPSMIVEDFENGITRMTYGASFGPGELYIDEQGNEYFQPQPYLLPSKEGMIRLFTDLENPIAVDTVNHNDLLTLIAKTGKKVTQNGKKGEWLEVGNWDGVKKYVFSGDFNLHCLRTVSKKKTNLYMAPNEKSELFSSLIPNNILFLDEKEKVSKIGTNQWIKVIYYGVRSYEDYEFKRHVVYLKGNDVEWVKLNK